MSGTDSRQWSLWLRSLGFRVLSGFLFGLVILAFLGLAFPSFAQEEDAAPFVPLEEAGSLMPESSVPTVPTVPTMPTMPTMPQPEVPIVDADVPDAEEDEALPVLGTEASFSISEGVEIVVFPPYGWVSGEEEDVPAPDLGQISGAEWILRQAWIYQRPHRRTSPRMFVICATAPSTDWASGMKSLVFERLNTIASSELGEWMNVVQYSPGPIVDNPPLTIQSFDARGRAGGQKREGAIRVLEADPLETDRSSVVSKGQHFLGFLSNPDRVLVCSTACMESARRNRGACSASMASIRVQGVLASEPSPTMMGRLVIGVKRKPTALLGTALGLVFALAGVLVTLRGLLIRPQ